MDKRDYRDKLVRPSEGYRLCDGGCHRGIPKDLDACPCECHREAIALDKRREQISRLAAPAGS